VLWVKGECWWNGTERNATSGGATEKVEILRNKGGEVEPKEQVNRLSRTVYLLSINDARSRKQCCHGNTMCVKYS